MVAGCPKCGAKYRVDPERIGTNGAKLRCTKCSAVFLVRAPKARSEEPQPTVAAPEPAAERKVAPAAPPAAAATTRDEVDPTRLVIVADPDEERGKACAGAIERWGLTPHLVHDGVEAMLAIQRMLPAAVVLDAALPKMYGFQVCEIVKRNESLRATLVVLVGAIHHQDRYRRDPSDLYGADVYVEQPDLPDGLLNLLRDAGLPVDGSGGGSAESSTSPMSDEAFSGSAGGPEAPVSQPAPVVSERAPEPQPEIASDPSADLDLDLEFETSPAPAPEPAADSPAPAPDESPERTEERERAQRLARIAVSEMLLYQPEKFDQATQAGNLEQVLDLEIQEARALLRQRISEEVRAECDFIMEELQRVAEDRRAQA